MKTKAIIALFVVLFFAEWLVLRPSTPGPSAKPVDASTTAQQSPRLSRLPRGGAPPSADETPSGNAIVRLGVLGGTNPSPELSAAQVEPYLQANKRNAESLLAALLTTGDHSYLREAKERFPNDPHVALMAVAKSDSPEEKRQWLDKLKQSAPDNALGNYLSASDYFKSGQAGLAVQEITAATGKSRLDDYTRDAMQNMQEAWRAAGYSEAEARVLGMSEVQLPALSQYKQVGVGLTNLAASYRQAGDEASARSLLQMGMSLSRQVNDPTTPALIQTLVGLSVQRQMLDAMDPAAVFGDSGQTVKSQLDELVQQRTAFRSIASSSEEILKTLPDEDLITYSDRVKVSGELNARRWLVAKYGQGQ